jgi:hypothetical protein
MTDRPADVEVSVSLRADELTLHEPLRIRTRTYPEQAERVEERVRENLPPEPSHGNTYRDVHVRRRVGTRLDSEESAEGRTRGD